jgi:hypothetical protein
MKRSSLLEWGNTNMDRGVGLGMDLGVRGWMFKTCKENFWRVSGFYEFNDLVQDGFLCYARLVKRYPDVKDAPHMMRLFQTSFKNHIHDIAKKRTRIAQVMLESDVGTSIEVIVDGREHSLPETSVLLAKMPPVLRDVLKAFASEKLRGVKRHRLNHRETTNEFVCRMIGANPEMGEVVKALHQYLGGEKPESISTAV